MRNFMQSARPGGVFGFSTAVLVAAVLGLSAGTVHAQTTWNNAAGGLWQVDGNWDTGTQPNTTTVDTVILNPAGGGLPVIVTLGPALTRSTGTLTIQDSGGVLPNQLIVGNNTFLNVHGNTVNNGQISLTSTGVTSRFGVGADLTLSGSGELVMSGTGAQIVDTGGPQNTFTHAAGHTIRGEGNIGGNNMGLANQAGALISADILGGTLLFDPGSIAATSTNAGTMAAANGGFFLFTGVFGGGLDNTGGTLRADGVGSEIQFTTSFALTGGQVASTTGGVVRVNDGQTVSWDGLTVAAGSNAVVGNNATLVPFTSLNNAATVNVSPANINSSFRIGSDVMLTGGGTIQMNAGTGGTAILNDNGGPQNRLTNVNNTIRGAGLIGTNNMAFTNQAGGLVLADLSGLDLLLDPGGSPADAATSFINLGTYRAGNGASLTLTGIFGGAFDNTGGTIEATGAGSAVRLVSSADVTGGTLRGVSGGVVQSVDGQSVSLTNVTAQGTHRVGNNADLFIAGTYTNQGTTHLDPGANNSDLRIGGNVTLTGGGTIQMNAGTGFAVINDGGGVQDRLTNVNNTIRGTGNIGNNNMAFTNQAGGLVLADLTGLDLFLDPGGAPADAATSFINLGTYRATNGASLTLSGIFGGAFDNTGGTIEATGAGSAIRLQQTVDVTGGILRGVSGGVVQSVDGQSVGLTNVTAQGTHRVGNNADLFIAGTYTNQGTTHLDPVASNSDLRIGGNVTLTGGGTIQLNAPVGGSGTAVINDGGGADQNRLTNVNNTIRGTGNLGANNMAFTNAVGGTVLSDLPGGLVIDPGSSPIDGQTAFINQGLLRVANASTLTMSGAFGGDFENAAGGTIAIDAGGTLNLTGTLTHRQGATIDQAGAFNVNSGGNFVNEADDYSPGASPGLLTVNTSGTFTNAASGVVTFEINGDTTPGIDFDTIRGDGAFNLDGGIDLVFGNGFTPAFYTSIELILDTNGRNVTGTLDPVFNPIVGVGEAWAITYRANQFNQVDAVLFTRALPGDANLSGQVEQGDLDAVLSNWGSTTNTSWGRGEMSGNGQVEQGDLDLVLANWGSALAPDFGSFDLAQVPEPATAALLGLGAMAMLRRRGA